MQDLQVVNVGGKVLKVQLLCHSCHLCRRDLPEAQQFRIPSGVVLCPECFSEYHIEHEAYHHLPSYREEVQARLKFEVKFGMIASECVRDNSWCLRRHRDMGHDFWMSSIMARILKPVLPNLPPVLGEQWGELELDFAAAWELR